MCYGNKAFFFFYTTHGTIYFFLLLLCDFEKGLLSHVLIIRTDLLKKEAIPSFIYRLIRHSFILVPIKMAVTLNQPIEQTM